MSARSVNWALTSRCNYRCRHCYLRGASDAAPPDVPALRRRADLLAAAGVTDVRLTGGEPLLLPDFLDFAAYLAQRHIAITQLATNGSLLTRELLKGLLALGHRPRVSVSYDGDDGEQERLRDRPDAARDALRAFDLCREAGLPTASEMTLYAQNAPVLAKSLRTLAAHGVQSVKVLPLFPVGRAQGALQSLTPAEFIELCMETISAYFAFGAPVELFLYGFFHYAPGEAQYSVPIARFRSDGDLNASLCWHALSDPYLSAEGRLLPCAGLAGFDDITSAFPLVEDAGFDGALAAEPFRRFSGYTLEKHLSANRTCRRCPSFRVCGGGCRICPLSLGLGFHGVDPYQCEFFLNGWQQRIPEAIRKGRLEALLSRAGN